MNSRHFLAITFALGLMAVVWVGAGFVGSNWTALFMTLVIGGVYLLGAAEIRQFRAVTASLASSMAHIPQPLEQLGDWIAGLHPTVQYAVRSRIEGERVALPGLSLTPYLVGLLVMLGMLGTFLGMVVTFKGAVFALEGSTDLQAIRGALAEPIKGLGLSFGTSVAGVAASAMLGLMSAISRRERLDVARMLDARVSTDFRPFSLVHQRQETFKALQLQSQALPAVVQQLGAFMAQMEQRSQVLNEQLLHQQAQFHRDATVAYAQLAASVEQSMSSGLAASARAAGESIQPVVKSAMAEMALQAQVMHEQVRQVTQTQLQGVSAQFSATATSVASTWQAALQQHAHTTDQLVNRLDAALGAFNQHFEAGTAKLLGQVHTSLAQSAQSQTEADQQRHAAWTQSLGATAAALQAEWQRVGGQTLAQQQAVCHALEKAATDIARQASQQASQALTGVAELLTRSEDMVRSRIEAEAGWLAQHDERMGQLVSLWRNEMAGLKADEAARGQAAVARLGELQSAVAAQLASLGAALEAPMTRLMNTASEVPEAAAGVITQLRQEMAHLSERDNLALAERHELVAHINTLLHSLNQASVEQRAALEAMVASATTVMQQAGSRFANTLEAQASQAQQTAEHVNASAAELARLGESFHQGVQLSSTSHDKLIDSLQRMDSCLQQSMARSDEQLAYYVAQAREVIDLSISSQQGIVENLRKLHAESAARAESAA